MQRRDFLKTTGLSLAALSRGTWGAVAGDPDPLATAEERIARIRQGDLALQVLDPTGAPLPPGVPLRVAQQRHAFLFGCNVFKLERCRSEADNVAYAERFADLLNFATLPFYWWNYERHRGQREDARTERTAQWCRAQGITTKGHPLAWNFVDPPWLAALDPAEAMRHQIARIERCVAHFAGTIDTWDVVNEATAYDRNTCKEHAPRLTQAIAEMGVGPYLRQAFAAARRANPKATLLINDYRTDPAYERRVLAELKTGQRAAYDVIGIQSHMHGGPWPATKTWEVCERFGRYGVPLHFTETTVVSGPKSPAGWTSTAAGEAAQAEAVAAFYTLLFSHPAVAAVTWWDFTDQDAWQGAPAGLVREDMSPKPAYERLHDLIKRRWWTRQETETGPEGRIALRAFLGDYRVSATFRGRHLSGAVRLGRDTGPRTLRLTPAAVSLTGAALSGIKGT